MEFKDLREMKDALTPCMEIDRGVTLRKGSTVPPAVVDRLAWTAVFSSDAGLRDAARYLIREAASARGAFVASIQLLYDAMGRGECGGFTVPAINIRGMTYDVARAVMRSARALEVGTVIFEIARSEMGYTEQRPAEYAAAVLAAALREDWRGPVFIQGDHFQMNAKKFARDPDAERSAIMKLIEESVPAGFLNIDIDTSTLVDLSRPTITEQQRLNFELAAEFTRAIRRLEPKGVTISVGGEIGEVGGKNSTPQELEAYMDGYIGALSAGGGRPKGISKISVQTGTTHGGIPLPDGRIAEVKLDFEALRTLSEIARKSYGMAGAVQHGASTLPEEAFDHFPAMGTAEIHLATGFQNIILDHDAFPADLRAEIRAHLSQSCADERKPGMTEEQFLYKTRKKCFGPFKRRMWELPASVRSLMARDLEARFELLFRKLNVAGNSGLTNSKIPKVAVPAPVPASLANTSGRR